MSDINEMKRYANQWIVKNKHLYYSAADAIWAKPELGLEEFHASALLTSLLKEHGFSVEQGQGGIPTAFVATYGTGAPCIGINAEYDCLPGMSQRSDVPYPCPIQEGAPGHGCGHNLLGTTAVLAATALRYAMERYHLPGTVQVLGSPYEEASLGKPVMGRAGVYQNLDLVLDWHPWDCNRADYDRCNSVFVLNVHFHGRACHGAYPWEGRSALDAGMLFGMALEMLREHIRPNGPDAANTINYTFQSCGPLFANVVPDTTTVQLYGRFADMKTSQDAFSRVQDCAKGAALATQTTTDFEVITYTHNKIPNQTLAEVVHKNLVQYGPPSFTEQEQAFAVQMQEHLGLKPTGLNTQIHPCGPSETVICDTSEFSWNAPYATFWLTLAPQGTGWHNWMVTACAGNSIGKKTMDRAAQILSSSALELLTSPKLVATAQAEWRERMGGNVYRSLLPENYRVPLGINRAVMEKYFGDADS